MRQFFRRATALTLALLLGLTPMAAASEALGDDLHTGTVSLAPGVELTRQIFWSNSKSDLRTERYFTYSPGSGVYPAVVYGDKVLDKQTLSAMAQSLESQGYRVVGGVNGDFYDMSTGNTLGVLISDGVLRSTSGGFYAVGFREDGSAFIGWPAISVTATFSGYTLQVTDVNKTRTALSNSTPGGYYLYTDDYSKTTQHTSPGIDVILSPVTDHLGESVDVDLDVSGHDGKPVERSEDQTEDRAAGEGETAPDAADSEALEAEERTGETTEVSEINATLVQTDQLQVGGRVSCVVEQVLESTGSIAIPEGKMVLTINKANNQWLVDMAAGLKPGDTVDIDVTSTDTRWNDAVTALGGFYRIVTNGQIGPNTGSTATPRTAVGIKADGTVVIYAIDGSQPGYSVGASLTQVAQRMIELGCVDVVGLDGGGSTTLGATLPTKDSMEIVNKPSQSGGLRAVSTGLFLIAKLQPTGEADHVYVSPYDSLLLSGASVPLYATVMDSAYYPMSDSGNVTWSISNGDGTVSSAGVFTAGEAGGAVQVTATAGRVSGQATMTVFRTPSSITLSNETTGAAVTSLALEPNQSVDLKASATYRNLSLMSQDTCYTWSADPAVGTVDENGVFTAGPKTATGNLTATAGGRTVTVPVTVAGHILELEDFEGDLTAFTGTSAASLSSETASDYVRFGRQSGKLDYDASAGGTAVLSSALPIAEGERYLNLWVYGDGSGNALTATITSQTGETSDVVLTGLDFSGWKRLSTALPENARTLSALNVVYGGSGVSSGTLWLDQITTANEDFVDETAPTVTLKVSGTAVTATVSDNVDQSFAAASLTLTLDGRVLDFQWDASKSALTAKLPAADGKLHRLTVTAADQSGNIGRASHDIQPASSTDPEAPGYTGPFVDMTTHWARAYTTYLYDMGVTNGVETTEGLQFQPEKNITRGEFALMVTRWMGLNPDDYAGVELPFADLASIPSWMLGGMKATYSLGILKGSLEGGQLVSRATETISRAEAMTILGRIQPKGYPLAALTFNDAASVAGWAQSHVQSLVGQGVISGYDNQLRPNDPVKRSEVAKMLYAIL